MISKLPHWVSCAIAVIAGITSSGCSHQVSKETLNAAEQSVKTALETWKQGQAAATLESNSPPIKFYDDDWISSAKLIEFQVSKTYLESDGTARCTVDLVIQHPKKDAERRQVTYQVVTKDNQTVIARDPFS